MADAVEKMLKEVFKDFEINSNIINAKIKSINLYKKANKLEINIFSDKKIKLKDVGAFEKYLVKRFMLKEAQINITYSNEIDCDFINEWDEILDYLSYKHPLTKALLKNSILNIDSNTLNINLKLSGSDILYGRNMDIVLSNLIFNTFGKKIKVKYIDNNSEETKEKVEQYREKMKAEVIMKVQEESVMQEDNEKDKKEEVTDSKKQDNNSKELKQEVSKDAKKEDKKEVVEEQEITPLILGRNQNIKDPLVKVIDISIDSGKIALEGEVINTDSRELKTGKFLFMFDLFDGTSTITCKAFIEKEKFKEVSRKNKICKRP